MQNFNPNFVHTVLFWLKDPNSLEDRNTFETSLKRFLGDSKYARTNFIGTPPAPSRDVVDGSFTYKLLVSFESAKAQDAYQVEPAHQKFIDECKDLWEKVVVYDAVGI